ncbi:MAG: hypothetical protein WBG70_16110 [Spirulinaceae cyanobacterium]
MTFTHFNIPSELEFLEAFGVEPKNAKPSDGFWDYIFEGENGLSLRLSFNQHEGSIQTALIQGKFEIATISHEGAENLEIVSMVNGNTKLLGTCNYGNETINLVIEISPKLYVSWSSLKNE